MAKFGHNGYSLARKAVNVGKKKNDVRIWFQVLLVRELLFSTSAFLVLRIQRNGLKKVFTQRGNAELDKLLGGCPCGGDQCSQQLRGIKSVARSREHSDY